MSTNSLAYLPLRVGSMSLLLDTRLLWLFWPIEWCKWHQVISKVKPQKAIQVPPCSLELISKRPHVVEKPKLSHVDEPHGKALRLHEETKMLGSLPLLHPSVLQASPSDYNYGSPCLDILPIWAHPKFPLTETTRDDNVIVVVLSR